MHTNTASPQSVAHLKNIGTTLAEKLKRIGVQTKDELARLGAANVYRTLQHASPEKPLPVCYYLYSLHAALTGKAWQDLTTDEKSTLRRDAGLQPLKRNHGIKKHRRVTQALMLCLAVLFIEVLCASPSVAQSAKPQLSSNTKLSNTKLSNTKTQPAMKLNAGIVTAKLKETKEFYTSVLGFGVTFENEWFVLLHTPNRSAEISFLMPNHESQQPIFRSAFSGTGMYLTIEVANVDDLYAAMKKKNIPLEFDLREEVWGDRHFAIRDPNGIGIDFVTNKTTY
jgi:catechol 2,3-dioxygenase-like lactoylglutathione lyase family enzyme